MLNLVIALTMAVLAVVMTRVFISLSTRRYWMDIPNERSAHKVPVPKGAGLVFILLLPILLAWLWFSDELDFRLYCAVMLCVPAGLLGLCDDFLNLGIRIRILIQALLVLILLGLYGSMLPIPLPGGVYHSGLWLMPMLFVACLWFFNLFNFMDGMDGFAAGETLYVILAALVLGDGGGGLASISWGLVGILLGFLAFNAPPARVFMGDAGSNFLALFLLVLMLESSQGTGINIWTWLILTGLFAVDSTVTLLRRMLQGEKWHLGHKVHAYQRLMARYSSHAKVLYGLMPVNLFWLLPLAWLCQHYPAFGLPLLLLAWLPLVVLALLLGAGSTST